MNKTKFRAFCRSKKNHNKLLNEKKIIHNIALVLKILKQKNILSFIPLHSEPNILKFMNKTRSIYNYQVPFMEDVSFKSVEYRMPLARKRFNLYESPNSFNSKSKIDIAIVPIIGVDGNFKRIGFGAGMYDRFFDRLKYKPIIIFTQLTECFTKAKICNTFDIRADIIITPKKVIYIRKKYGNYIGINRRNLCNSSRDDRFFSCKKD